ncbi:MAG: 2-amino-4-hydroxy-6-hydroxymethyldihydropteridine diphosphokinase [Bacteroidia bacterium]|nr:2-amino-4-hydroxy-6-hydroxymethyldihydropteridine diphosphokinase [Bacteroidia bacterium]
MKNNYSYLLLGSNLEPRHEWLKEALFAIERQIGDIWRKSSVFESEPWGFSSENYFLNQALYVNTSLSAEQLIDEILKIEDNLGRKRTKQCYTGRNIDIDIIFYNENIINSEKLTIPHPYMHQRRFALEPVAEIAPLFIHPVLKKTMLQLLDECEDKLNVKKICLGF